MPIWILYFRNDNDNEYVVIADERPKNGEAIEGTSRGQMPISTSSGETFGYLGNSVIGGRMHMTLRLLRGVFAFLVLPTLVTSRYASNDKTAL